MPYSTTHVYHFSLWGILVTDGGKGGVGMSVKCSTKDCKWSSSDDQCSNNQLVNQVRTGAVSSSSCSGKSCKGYQLKS